MRARYARRGGAASGDPARSARPFPIRPLVAGTVVIVLALSASIAADVGALAGEPARSARAISSPAPIPSSITASASPSTTVRLVVDPPPLMGVRVAGAIHEAFVPGTFTMTRSSTVHVTVFNYGPMDHTWTSRDLGVDANIPPGSKSHPSVTHFTIHPIGDGTFAWFCTTPCDSWSMDHNGYMKGTVTVTG